VVLDNVARFDFYIQNNQGDLLLNAQKEFNSNTSMAGYTKDTYPGTIDVYLQVTSYESMRQAGRMLRVGKVTDSEIRSVMDRDSNVLVSRIFPVLAPAHSMHPLKF
jgi:hypothetical protein